jgi:hypothetical protein
MFLSPAALKPVIKQWEFLKSLAFVIALTFIKTTRMFQKSQLSLHLWFKSLFTGIDFHKLYKKVRSLYFEKILQ